MNQTLDTALLYLHKLRSHYLRRAEQLEDQGNSSYVGVWGASTGVEKSIVVLEALKHGWPLPEEIRGEPDDRQ